MPVAINGTSGAITGLAQLPDSAMASGSIIQVVQAVKTDTFSTTSSSFVDITGLSATITPSSSSSKILFQWQTNFSHKECYNWFQLVRGSTALLIGDAAGSRTRATHGHWIDGSTDMQFLSFNFAGSYLDSPSTTSATTYKLQIRATQNSAYVNRSQGDSDNAVESRTASNIVLMEVAA